MGIIQLALILLIWGNVTMEKLKKKITDSDYYLQYSLEERNRGIRLFGLLFLDYDLVPQNPLTKSVFIVSNLEARPLGSTGNPSIYTVSPKNSSPEQTYWRRGRTSRVYFYSTKYLRNR